MTTQQQSEQEKVVGQIEMTLRENGRNRMAGNTVAFLRNHAPFNKMKPEALQHFAEKAQIAFYPAGSEIIGPAAGNVRLDLPRPSITTTSTGQLAPCLA